MKVMIDVRDTVEADVPVADIIEAIVDIAQTPERVEHAYSLISQAFIILRAIPDDLVAQVGDKHRQIILDAMRRELARYESAP